MNILSDLVDAISERKMRLAGRGENQATQLYKGIKGGKFDSEKEAITALYGEKPFGVTYFNATKRKLRELLINSFLATVPKKENYWEKGASIQKKILVAEHLGLTGRVQSAIQLMSEAFSESVTWHCTASAWQAAQRLSAWYAGRGDHQKFQKYHDLEQSLWEQLNWERRAESYLSCLSDLLRDQKGIDNEAIAMARQFKEELSGNQQDTFGFRMYAHYIAVIYYELMNEGEKVVQTCHEAYAFFNRLPFELPNRTHRYFTVRMIPPLIQTGRYAEAVKTLALAEQYVQKGSRNWAGMQEYKVIAAFHLHDLEMVQQAITLLRSSRTAFAAKREEVRVYEGYLSFFKDEELSRFKVGKFMNEMPIYGADKKGMNINILIIQILILLRRRKLGPIIDRMEALRSYAYRHLKNDPATRRSDLFIQLLLLLSRYAFDSKLVREISGPLLTELSQEPRQLQTIDIEIVPYELLWEEILKALDS